jgi:phosphatidylserine decarboxylase
LYGKSNPFIAREGMPYLALTLAIAALLFRYYSAVSALVPLGIFVLLVLLFRDPRRGTPGVALGVVSPVDGRVVEVGTTNKCVIGGEAHRVAIRISSLGTYTARSPVEGRIMDLQSRDGGLGPDCPANALWLQTDEGDDIVLHFYDYRLGLAPKAFLRFGERVGQGHRFANLRLAGLVELYLPITARIEVEKGQKVLAGTGLIGRLQQH